MVKEHQDVMYVMLDNIFLPLPCLGCAPYLFIDPFQMITEKGPNCKGNNFFLLKRFYRNYEDLHT